MKAQPRMSRRPASPPPKLWPRSSTKFTVNSVGHDRRDLRPPPRPDARPRLALRRRRLGDWLDLRLLRDLRNNDARGGLDPARASEPERRSSPSSDP